MKRIIPLLLLSIVALPGLAQRVTIEDCYRAAQANYPLIKQYGLIEKSMGYNLSNAAKGYLPQAQLSGKATYQSAVTEIPVDIPGVTAMSKDQYGATLDITQTIWDGGSTSARRESIRTEADVQTRNLDVTMYEINDRVNQLFFAILLLDATLDQNQLFLDELQRNYDQVKAYMQNGIANRSDLDAVEVEQLKARQNRTKIIHNRSGYMEMLSALTGQALGEQATLVRPESAPTAPSEIHRPELALFDAQSRNLDAMQGEVKAGLRPRLSLFATGGYGKPGLNMLENQFKPYYIGGVRLSWNLGSFYTKNNNLRLIQSNREGVEVQRAAFLLNTDMNISRQQSEIDKARDLLSTDDRIVALRQSVRQASEQKVAGGTMSVIDLMREVNNEQLARQEKIQHELELVQAIYNMKFITNN